MVKFKWDFSSCVVAYLRYWLINVLAKKQFNQGVKGHKHAIIFVQLYGQPCFYGHKKFSSPQLQVCFWQSASLAGFGLTPCSRKRASPNAISRFSACYNKETTLSLSCPADTHRIITRKEISILDTEILASKVSFLGYMVSTFTLQELKLQGIKICDGVVFSQYLRVQCFANDLSRYFLAPV